MTFQLKTLLGLIAYCCGLFIALHYVANVPLALPFHISNLGLLQFKINGQLHDVELLVWLPAAVLLTVGYFRFVRTPGLLRSVDRCQA